MRGFLVCGLLAALASCSDVGSGTSGLGGSLVRHTGLPSLAELDTLPVANRAALAADIPRPGAELTASSPDVTTDGTAAVIVPGGDDALAWGLYTVGGLKDNRPVDINVNVSSVILPGGDDPLAIHYWVAVADHTLFHWKWYGPFSASSGGFNLNSAGQRERIINATGTMHYVVAVLGAPGQSAQTGNGVRVETTTVKTRDALGDPLYEVTLPHYTPASVSVPAGTSALAAGSFRHTSALDPSQYVTIMWTHVHDELNPAFEANLYKVYRTPHGGDFVATRVLLKAPTAHDGTNTFVDPVNIDTGSGIPDPQPGLSYDYYLVTVNDVGNGPPVLAGAIVVPLLAPAGLTASDGIYPAYVQLDWAAVDGAAEYRIYRDGTLLVTVPAPATSYQDATAVDLQTYNYEVEAATPDAVSPRSALDSGYRGQWKIMPVDETPINSGYYISMLPMSDNLLAISYLKPSPSSRIMFAKAQTALPTTSADWLTSVALSPASTQPDPLQCDESNSLMVVGNLPAIAFYDNFQRRLAFARSDSNGPAGEGDWTVQEVDDDDPGSLILGWSLDAAYVNGKPAISYMNATNQSLYYARATTATPGSNLDWNSYAVVPNAFNLSVTGLLRLNNDHPAMCYYNGNDHQLYWTMAGRPDPDMPTDWTTPYAIDSSGDAGKYISAVNDTGGFPVLLYKDLAAPGLKCATTTKLAPASPADWSIHTVDNAGNCGAYASAAIVGGKLAVAYFDQALGELRLATARVASPASSADWSISTIDSGDMAGQWCCLVELNGKPAIAYQRSPNDLGDLWFARAE